MLRKKRLEQLFGETGAFKYSPDEPFRLSSGTTSDTYFDLRLLHGNPEALHLVAQEIYDKIKDRNIKSVGGIETGSVGLAAAISQLSYLENQKNPANPVLKSFYVRKYSKDYGTQRIIEGTMESPCIIIDDVIVSGKSALKAENRVRDAGGSVHGIICVLFRGKNKKAFESIFDKDELVGARRESDPRPTD